MTEPTLPVTQTVVAAAAGVVTAAISAYCAFKVAQLKAHINSRMDELLKLTSTAAHAAGKLEGIEQQKIDTLKSK